MMAPNKLNPHLIEEMVESHQFIRTEMSPTLTICVLKLKNGADVVGTSNVIDPVNYDRKLGEQAALANAKGRIWELEGYAMRRDMNEREGS